MAIIYRASFPNGKSYVGFTTRTLDARRRDHIRTAATGGGQAFHAAIRKYGADAVEWTVLEQADDAKFLFETREDYWIREYKSMWSQNGYNICAGGSGRIDWWASLSDDERSMYAEIGKSKLDEYRHSEKRKARLKECWEGDVTRRDVVSTASKLAWADPLHRAERSKNISAGQKELYSSGRRVANHDSLLEASNKARVMVSGSKWYNDGLRNYRLKPGDPRIDEMKCGRLNDKPNRASSSAEF